jgi:hypothetical protein
MTCSGVTLSSVKGHRVDPSFRGCSGLLRDAVLCTGPSLGMKVMYLFIYLFIVAWNVTFFTEKDLARHGSVRPSSPKRTET